LLRRYLTKNNPRANLEDLDFETVDNEMETEEANAAEGPMLEVANDEGTDTRDNPVV